MKPNSSLGTGLVHVADGSQAADGNHLPYLFGRRRYLGRALDQAQYDIFKPQGAGGGEHQPELGLPGVDVEL